jgi:formylglycine-generating enzyme required for sulfatase activity
MEDWILGLGVLLCAVLWVQIFLDYRSKLGQVQPRITEVSMEKDLLSQKIEVTNSHIKEANEILERMNVETERLEGERQRLQRILNQKEMVLIPAGNFVMGNDFEGNDDEQPCHEVRLSAYYLDPFEVTNEEYRDFIEVTGCNAPSHWRNRSYPEMRLARHPVVNVTWKDAAAYAVWVGKRLPTQTA